jgi:hypothetical protein
MANWLVIESFEGIYDDQHWRMRAGDIVDDAQVPVAALKAFGFSAVAYAAGMQTAIDAFNEQYAQDPSPPSMLPTLESYDVIPSVDAVEVRATSLEGRATTVEGQLDGMQGSAAVAQIIFAGQPLTTETIDIGGDTYTVDGAGAFGFALAGSAELTMDNLLAAIQADGTENLVADKLSATTLRLRSAAAPNGAVAAADPDIALDASGITNVSFDVGDVNMNTLAGHAAGETSIDVASIAITADMITATEVRVAFPFTVARFSVQVLTAAGAFKAGVTDTFAIANGDVLITLAGGGGDLAATDVVTVTAAP